MTLDYSYKPEKKEVLVSYINNTNHNYYSSLEKELNNLETMFAIQVRAYEKNNKNFENCKLKHIIIITDINDPEIATNKFNYLLKHYHTMSLGIIYDNERHMLSHTSVINNLKLKYDGKINFLRPDISLDKTPLISLEKITDNAICDTIRIKYNPNQINKEITLSKKEKFFFTEISKIYSDLKLYHRSASDGYFSLRRGEEILITATKTFKNPLDLTRISLIHAYDKSTNMINYSGRYLPSSDGVEAMIVYENNPAISAIIHTHASDVYTRNKNFSHKIQVRRDSYGIPKIGFKINKIVKDYYDDFFIMEEHGELFIMLGDAMEIVHKFNNLVHQYS